MFGPGGDGAHAREEWVSLSDTEAVTRVLVEVARRVLRMRALVNRDRAPEAVPPPSTTPRRSIVSLPGYRPPPSIASTDRGRARARSGRREGRVRPARAAGLQGARRLLGRRAAARGAAGDAHARRRQRREPRPRRRPRRRAAGPSLPRVPPRPLAGASPRRDRRRGSRGRGRRRQLRGRRRGGAPPTGRPTASRRSPTSAASDTARWVIDGYATLFAELAPRARSTSCSSRSASARSARRPRGSPREAGATMIGVEPVTAACLTASLAAARRRASRRRARRWRARLRRGLRHGVADAARRRPRHGDGDRRRGRGRRRELAGRRALRSASRAPRRSRHSARWSPTPSAPICALVGLGADSRVLLVATEGPTGVAA